MSSKKILLVKKLPDETRVTSVVVGETGFYWRSFANPQEVAAALQNEDFGLLFFDHRGVAGDPLAFIESVRDAQKKTPVFLISDPLEMSSIIQAIRQGVKDYFHPPLDLRLIIERVQSVLKTAAQDPDGVQLGKWNEFVMFLADGSIGNGGNAAKRDARKAEVTEPGSLSLKAERDGFAAELNSLRGDARKAQQECARLEAEVARLKSAPSEKPKQTVPVATNQSALGQLQRDLEAEREKLEEERLLFKQAQKKWESSRGAAAAPVMVPDGTQTSVADRKLFEEKNRQLSAAQEKLEEELLLLVQSKARLEKDHALKVEQSKAVLAETAVQQKKLAGEQSAWVQTRLDWEKSKSGWEAGKAKTEADFATREQALARVNAEAKKLADAQTKLAVEQEKLETDQSLLQQAKNKLEKLRAENEERFTQRENALVDRVLALDVRQKNQSEAEDQFLIEQEKLDATQVLLLQRQQALDQAKLESEKNRALWQAEKTQAEAELARREKALAGLDAELKKLADGQKALVLEQEKVEAGRDLLKQAEAKLERSREENEAKYAQRERELAKRTGDLETGQKARDEADKQLLIEQERLDAALLLANQTKTRLAQEAKTFEEAKAAWDKKLTAAEADKAKAEAALQKRIEGCAEREAQIQQKEKSLAPLQAQLAAEQEKLESEQIVVKQTLSKVSAERAELVATRSKLEQAQREMAAQEASLQESEVKTQTQLTQLKKLQTQVAADQATMAADKAELALETAALEQRTQHFEKRQQQFKDQMKQMLSGS